MTPGDTEGQEDADPELSAANFRVLQVSMATDASLAKTRYANFFFLWERFLSIDLDSFIGEGDKRSYWQAKKPPWFSFWWGLALQFPCPQKPMASKPHSY